MKILLTACVAAANAFYLLCIIAAHRFFSKRKELLSEELPPATIMIPLNGADFGAYQNYAEFCQQDYPRYQIVFGVRDASDTAVPVVEKLITDFPDSDIELVICPDAIGQNLKVSNLQNMLSRVKHDRIVIVDSDIRVGRDWLRRIVPILNDRRVGLVTCLYRAAEAPGFAAKIEAIGITAEFHPGVLVARMLEGVKFALGSTMATTRERLDEIGGFHALKDYLADDFMLGNLIAARGYAVQISDYVVELRFAPTSFWSMMRHQMRWSRSTRRSRPAGYFGLILTYGTALALLNAGISAASMFSLILLGATLIIRMMMGWMIGVHWLGDKILKKNFLLLPARDVLSFVIWCLSWVGKRVEWRGRTYEIVGDGKIVEVDDENSLTKHAGAFTSN
ncbi:MAG TPA: bacteriohopanetetrol glucosamine biosynthesis glycosyltransferase HpnI [Blastocatellia bacterium]|nr:bacteriohopanetetrol glucosamine biosynthesis glycosyltransferase HpnI [Blastocatellia bacterium]